MKHMEELREMLCRELDEISRGPLDLGSLDVINKLTHSIKSIDTIMAMEERGGYSREGSNRSYEGSYDGAYDGASYRRGRSATTGRYISRASSRYSRDYSRDDGMKEKLEELLQDAPDDKTRQELQRLIDKM